MAVNDLPLKNITVCDFSWVGAGPIATNIMGQFGGLGHGQFRGNQKIQMIESLFILGRVGIGS